MSLAEVSTEYAVIPPEERQRCIDVALEAIKFSHSLRAPRNIADRQNGFACWIAQWRDKMKPIVYAALRREMPDLFLTMPDAVLSQVVEQNIWADVAAFLYMYGITYQAGMWGRKHFGDATLYYNPVHEGNHWRVPIGVRGYGENLGQIILDEDGNVIESLTSMLSQAKRHQTPRGA